MAARCIHACWGCVMFYISFTLCVWSTPAVGLEFEVDKSTYNHVNCGKGISGDSTAPSHCWFFHPTPIRLHGIAQVGGSSRTLLPLSSLRRVRAGSISVSTEPCKKWQRVWPRHCRLVELEAQRGWVVTGMMVTGMIPNQRMLGTRWVLGRHPWRPSHNAKP